ncbi:Lrp/AsnC family transcriptional regulator [Salisaeta longa]|uniref:Lrp/AsnC family transcriptional regulator n=1 Tax=Salisaeta longa TaxID=503170 RepID=UPI0003B44D34|nr:Lrp/AsnC family transcriptional regulator [Salisaeta longa]
MALLDDTDYAILRAMQRDARIQNKTLAEEVGVAESTCLERVRRLRENGVLTGFHATVDAAAVGIQLQAMITVQLSKHSQYTVDRFRSTANDRPEVLAVYHLGGRTDFMLHVAVRGSEHLRDFILSALTTRPEVQNVETSIIFDQAHSRTKPIYPDQAR